MNLKLIHNDILSESTLDLLTEVFKDDWYYNQAGYTLRDRIDPCKEILEEIQCFNDNKLVAGITYCVYDTEKGHIILDDGIYPQVKDCCEKYTNLGNTVIFVTNVFVDENYRKKGISKILLSEVEKLNKGKFIIMDADNPITLKLMKQYPILETIESNYWLVGGKIS